MVVQGGDLGLDDLLSVGAGGLEVPVGLGGVGLGREGGLVGLGEEGLVALGNTGLEGVDVLGLAL